MVNYIIRYIYFMKILEEDKENNTWLKRYIDSIEIDQRLVNTVVNEDFGLTQMNYDHWSAINQYIFFKILGQYFSRSMHK